MAAIAGPRLGPFRPGLEFASQRVLRFGIVLLGARLSLGEIARIGLPATGPIVVTMALSFAHRPARGTLRPDRGPARPS